MRPLWSHASGIHFGSEFHSIEFARTLELAVGGADTANMLPEHRGFIQVFAPTAGEQSEPEANAGKALEHLAVPSEEPPAAA